MQWLIEVLGTSMDGFGIYVWPSYLISAAVMVVLVVVSLRSLRRARHALRALESAAHEA